MRESPGGNAPEVTDQSSVGLDAGSEVASGALNGEAVVAETVHAVYPAVSPEPVVPVVDDGSITDVPT